MTVCKRRTSGAWRTLSGATLVLTAPDAPQNLSVTAGDSSASLSWQVPLSNGGAALTGYTITAVPSPSGSTVTGSAAAGATSGTISGLTNTVSYTVSVAATNSVGTGTSSPGFAVTPVASGALVKPTAANTGCRTARGSLTAITGASIEANSKTGSPTLSYTDKLITGGFRLWCNNVVFTDCVFESSAPGTKSAFYLLRAQFITGTQVRYCTFNGLGSVTGGSIDTALEASPGGVVDHCDISGCTDGVHPGTSGSITNNYIHGCIAPSGAHSDAYQFFGSCSGLYVARNNIDNTDGLGSINSAVQYGGFAAGSTVVNYTFEDNWINGGNFQVSGGYGTTATPTNVVHRRNRFGLSMGTGALYNSGTGNMSVIFTADATNVWDVTGSTTTGRSVTADTAVS